MDRRKFRKFLALVLVCRRGVFYRPIICLVKCLVIVFFARLTKWPEVQIIAISSSFFLVGLLFSALRPFFRQPIFNILVVSCLWIVLTCYGGVIGILLELNVENSLLTGDVIAITAAGLVYPEILDNIYIYIYNILSSIPGLPNRLSLLHVHASLPRARRQRNASAPMAKSHPLGGIRVP